MAKNEQNRLSDAELELLFQAAREEMALPSEALWAQVLADSEASMAPPLPLVKQSPPRIGLLAGLIAAIGGWPGMAGLTTAIVAGVWIGVSNPEQLNAWAEAGLLPVASSSYQLEDFEPDYHGLSALLDEG